MTKALVVVPTYNERENLELLIPELLKLGRQMDVLVVDDASPDGTGQFARDLSLIDSRVHVLQRPGKQGLGTAYIAGFRWALARDYDVVVQMDADLSHRPEDLPKLLDNSSTADLTIGSRNVPGGRVFHWSIVRRSISRFGSFYTRAILGLPVRDCTSGFKCFRRQTLEALDLDGLRSNGYGFQIEVNYLCHLNGARILEVPITFPDRTIGRSKMTAGIALEAAQVVIDLRRNEKALRHASALSRISGEHVQRRRLEHLSTGVVPGPLERHD